MKKPGVLKIVLFGLALVVALAMGVIYVWTRTVGEFWVDTKSGIAPMHWKLGKFRPFYVGKYNKDGSEYLKGLYWERGWVKIKPILINGKLGGVEIPGEKLAPKLRFGQRFEVVYISQTDNPADGEVDGEAYTCPKTFRHCVIGDWIYRGNKSVDKNSTYLSVLSISSEVKNGL